MKKRILGVLILASAALYAGCVVVPHRPFRVMVHGPPIEYGYQPLLYNGHVVFYSDVGVPFYWYNGARVWIPVTYRQRYVTHWHQHKNTYRVWHKHRGHHYRTRHYEKHRDQRKSVKPIIRSRVAPKPGPEVRPRPVVKPKDVRHPTHVVKPKKKKKKDD